MTGGHQENMSRKYIPPLTPLLYTTNGLFKGKLLSIFGPKTKIAGTLKNRRVAGWAVLTCTHNQCFEQK